MALENNVITLKRSIGSPIGMSNKDIELMEKLRIATRLPDNVAKKIGLSCPTLIINIEKAKELQFIIKEM